MSAIASQPLQLPRRAIAFAVICLVHLAAIWAFARAVAVHAWQAEIPPIETRILEPTRPPPPPPPAPVPVNLRDHAAIRLPLPEVRIALPADVPVPSPAPPAAAVASTGQAATGGGQRPRSATPMTFVSAPNVDYYYPPLSRDLNEQGGVITRVCTRADGSVDSARIVRGSGHSRLDTAALSIARQTRWRVATVDGRPTATCENFFVNFSLRE